MTGKRRKLLISLAIVVLVSLNILRWWPASTASTDRAERAVGAFNAEDFEVKAMAAVALPPLSRDIFSQKKAVANKPQAIAAPAAIQPVVAKSPEDLARDSAQAEFAQIRCVGVSVRKEREQAYLNNSGEHILVSNGDKVGSRFIVEKIVQDGVSLRDPGTGVGGIITISGK